MLEKSLPTSSDNSQAAVAQAEKIKVWDLPIRIFHWGMVCLFFTSWVSADQGFMTLHLVSGSAILALLLFRIVWGFVGSTTARFSDFLGYPGRTLRYLGLLFSSEQPVYSGHNPAGGWMVMALLACLCIQVSTGLFSNDDVRFNAPLSLLVSKELSDQLTVFHGTFFNFILVLVWMHLVAVFFHLSVKGENLIGPMFTGKKHVDHVPAGTGLMFAPLPLALLLLVLCAGIVWWVVAL
jgi:cytochrome b